MDHQSDGHQQNHQSTLKQTSDISTRFYNDQQLVEACRELRILIVKTRWNSTIIESLQKGCIETLLSLNVKVTNILIEDVPGSYELPWACSRILSNAKHHLNIDAIIAIGTLIKGETMHFEYISESVSNGLMRVSLNHNKPIIFGVLTCLNDQQARHRSGLLDGDSSKTVGSSTSHNHGCDWAKAAVECSIKSKMFHHADHKFKSAADL
ncbi:6,7-dimethyl-8-ribityllumazine synthase [Phakopsora pachyrhizi]|uniref:6,7-dimethyl-8-ribityllumazine synthase n=1 Tax=Phakopsora pachyrhizi TaxID=170000 RepID=A0AAV0ADK8_PHAPC|nr:6,7-dimethyl-8-ribityllumazine synthase [Phakopsora pachyrhizi]CAH7666089.1 6,7-dimethyl-8-ribityllumazine synthase [Phakopsora pachyrhizi]